MSAAVPYGITLSVSCDLLILRRYLGLPTFGETAGFALGAAVAFALLALGGEALGDSSALPRSRALLRVGMRNSVAILLSLLVAFGLSQTGSWLAWPCTGASSIAVYLGVICLDYAVLLRLE
ncbi:MAG TPA: hypothetical protein VGQ38_10125 [Gaiellaceae bacterium]|nr:hypothetical protein [Gaiellaceae bacterium]